MARRIKKTKSIIQTEKECYVCETTMGLHDHHIFAGKNRRNSEEYGMKVWLCGKHHNLSNEGVHFNKNLDDEIKKMAQRVFEDTYEIEFIKVFGRNYLWEEENED